ncbi:MAG: helix-turn-helix transcriptional regulator [Victivallales bacterium]
MAKSATARGVKIPLAMETGLFSWPSGTYTPIVDPGAGVRWSFGLTLAGEVEDLREDGRSIFQKGDFVLMKPGARHGWRVPENGRPWRCVWFIFDALPEWFSLLDLPEFAPGHCLVRLGGRMEERRVRHAFLEAHRHLTDRASALTTRLANNAMERGFLWVNAAHSMSEAKSDIDTRVTRATLFIRRRLGETVSLSDIAESAGVSASRLLSLFKQHVNLAPMEYLERERLRRAGDLLANSGLSVKQIAAQCGYSNQRYFATRFKAGTGNTPSQARANIQR